MQKLYIYLLLLCSISLYANKYALVIGIGKYPQVDDGWWIVNGDKDVPLIYDMLVKNGFEPANITQLINSEATYKGIGDSFRQLTERADKGDTIYIHFSGHGQQITDINGDEADGFDEAWIPYDALMVYSEQYRGERHLTDDTLNKWLHAIRYKIGKEGKLSVSVDACYSGTSTRNIEDNDIYRGTSLRFEIPNVVSHKIAPLKDDWITLTACADNEFVRQVKIENNYFGSLSYALYRLSDQISRLSAAELTVAVKELFDHLLPRTQQPQLDGPELLKLQPLL